MAITAYRVFTMSSMASLDSLVSAAIADGWQPYGSPVLSPQGLSQAVIQGTPDGGGGGQVVDLTSDDITDATAIGKSVIKAADAAAARLAIGAGTGNGTSNLKIGATAADAKAGNYSPSTKEVGDALKAKAQLMAIAALAPDATLEQTVTGFNALLAALKA